MYCLKKSESALLLRLTGFIRFRIAPVWGTDIHSLRRDSVGLRRKAAGAWYVLRKPKFTAHLI